MSIIKPQIFVSYSRKDADYVHQVRTDLISSRVDCWMDQDSIQTGDRLNPVIEEAISGSSLFFAYVTKSYLESRWCMKEFEYALKAPGVTVAPFANSEATQEAVPQEIRDEIVIGILNPDNYSRSLLELAGRSWASLQTVKHVVPAHDHILAGPAIFDSAGYNRHDLMERTKSELVLAGSNLRSWMSDDDAKRGLVAMVKDRLITTGPSNQSIPATLI